MKIKNLIILFAALLLNIQLFAQQKPNVIVVLADDIGVGDISHYRRMHSDNIILETPNIDALAKAGTVFTQAHSPAALCAPSRYAVMTGNSCYRSPFPWGVWGSFQETPIKDADLTLGRLMKQAGYNTAFLGKWHLGGSYYRKSRPGVIYRGDRSKLQLDVDITKVIDGPQQKGFDYSFTYPAGIQAIPYTAYENGEIYPYSDKPVEIGVITQENMTKIGVTLDKAEGLGDMNWDPRNAGPMLAGKGVDYIRKHAKADKPFFMYYCSQAVHLPHNPPKEINGVKIEGTTPCAHMDMIKELDVQMGMLVDELKKQGIYENTIFIFTSDNGGLTRTETLASGHNPSSIYRGGKNKEHEGGHRVPFIVSWPKELKPGKESDELALGLDIAATLAEITGTSIPENQAMDSYSLMPILKKGKKLDRDYIMLQSGTGRQLIIIEDEWKLIIQCDRKDKTDMTREAVALFNLKDNPEEKEELNLVKDPAQKARVEALFNIYNKTRASKARTGS